MPNVHGILFGSFAARVAAIAFDKDGTLLATEPFWRELYRIRYEQVLKIVGPAAAEEWREVLGASQDGRFDRGGPFTVGSAQEEMHLTAGVIYRHTRWPWDVCRRHGEEVFRRTDELIDLTRVAQPLPGVVETVKALKDRGLAVGIVTSDTADRALRSMELAGVSADTWDFVLGAESVERHKPAPDLILEASRITGVPPSQFAVVGDSRVDMEMAKNAGSLAVGVRENGNVGPGVEDVADVVIDGVKDIKLL